MSYIDRFRKSFVAAKKNPALLSVLILKFILSALLFMLFAVVDTLIIIMLNKSALQFVPVEMLGVNSFLNAKTVFVASILFLVELFIFTYVNSFFNAGFYAMIKNMMCDGSTLFKEFFPEAKKYWAAFFRLLLVKYALFLIVALPLIVGLISYLATVPSAISTTQAWWLIGSIFFFGLATITLFFVFLYAGAVLVYEREDALPAMKASLQLIKNKFWYSVCIGLTIAGLFFVAFILSALLLIPFEKLAQLFPDKGVVILHDIASFVLNIVTLIATVITSIFLFMSYDELTMKRVKKSYGKAKKKH